MSQNNMELPITENARLNELAAKANQSETPTVSLKYHYCIAISIKCETFGV